MFLAASGGVTHFAVCPDEDDTVMTVAWYVRVYFIRLRERIEVLCALLKGTERCQWCV